MSEEGSVMGQLTWRKFGGWGWGQKVKFRINWTLLCVSLFSSIVLKCGERSVLKEERALVKCSGGSE